MWGRPKGWADCTVDPTGPTATQSRANDGVLLTGFSHALNVSEVVGVMATYHQATQDPNSPTADTIRATS